MWRCSNEQQTLINCALVAAGCAIAFVIYAADATRQPPGFYIDESSIAYNAYTIAQTGADEYGTPFPLYFRAFGDYKNPVYIYLLAAIFRITGPAIVVGRLLSACLGAFAAVLLGVLASRLANRPAVGVLVTLSALMTPWLYESSRLVLEVAAFPVAIVLFLLVLHRASTREIWTAGDVSSLAITLALLTYTYSIGRLLAPLLAVGLGFFARRGNRSRVLQVWAAYALTLAPLVIFSFRNPGALTNRFVLITYLAPHSGVAGSAAKFIAHYIHAINPWRWLVTGESNIRDHIPGTPALLAPTVLLACAGLVIVLRKHSQIPWWRFLLYALALSIVPAALTTNEFPQLRLIAFPLFLHLLLVPSMAWLLEAPFIARRVLYVLVATMLAQGVYFQWLFHVRPPERWYVFDARFPSKILAPALTASGGDKIYLQDRPARSGYIQALWHGTLSRIGSTRFIRLRAEEMPPAGAVVISSDERCANCRLLARSINYIVYAVEPTTLRPSAQPLEQEGMGAELTVLAAPTVLPAGGSETFEVLLRNVGRGEWPAVGDGEGRDVVQLCDRWLGADGSLVLDNDTCAAIPYDMEPGDTAGLTMTVKAPSTPGEYVLQVDLVQRGVGWFGANGSKPFQARVTVAPRL
jgi:hypothetical protein